MTKDVFVILYPMDGYNLITNGGKEMLSEEIVRHMKPLEEESETQNKPEMGVYAKEEQETGSRSIYDLIEAEIMESELPLDEKNKKLSRLRRLRKTELSIMLVGATGVGKSSTINAMFDMSVAKVGVGVDPETDQVQSYRLENLTIWDTPGLGDSPEQDEANMELIREKLSEQDEDGVPVIDLVLVLIDASQKDLNTVYDCIGKVIVPALGDEAKKRILICLNQADMAMKGRHWNEELNAPDAELMAYLDKKAIAVRKRISETTGINFKPVYYCAGYTEEGGEQRKPYNLAKLLYCIMAAVPKEKRLALADVMNPDEEMWAADDGKADYKDKVRNTIWDSVVEYSAAFADKGLMIGIAIAGVPGGVIFGGTFGAAGALYGFVKGIFDHVKEVA